MTHAKLRLAAVLTFIAASTAGCSIGHIETGIGSASELAEPLPTVTYADNAHLVPAYSDADRQLMAIQVWKYAQ